MKLVIKTYSYTSLISSIIFLILGAILMTNADSIITIISYIIGSILILSSAIKFLAYQKAKKINENFQSDLVIILILLAFGIACFFLGPIFEAIVRFIIGGWILFIGLNRLVGIFNLDNPHQKNRLALLIVAIFLVGIGLFTILYSNIIFKWLGIFMIVYAVLDIIGYLFFTHNAIQKEKTK